MAGILCEHCTALCCRYIALPIDEPESRRDFDDIRWYLLHDGVSVFIEDGDWYINIQTTCRHLQPDYRCGIYATRPQICREYSTDNCDYHTGDYGWDHHFSAPEHLDAYLAEHPPKRRRRRGARGAQNGRGGRSNGRPSKNGRARPRLKARLRRTTARRRKRVDYASATSDLRGVPLPILMLGSALGSALGSTSGGRP